MELLLLIFVWMVAALWPLWVILLLIYILRRRHRPPAAQPTTVTAGQPTTTDVIDRAAFELRLHQAISDAEQFPDTAGRVAGLTAALELLQSQPDHGSATIVVPVAAPADSSVMPHIEAPLPPPRLSQPLSNTVALLYLGALLFVSAVALFVLLAPVSGGVKTALVLITGAALYGGGLAIRQAAPKLAPAAVAFASIGIATVPFVGLAAHSYLGVSSQLLWVSLSVVSFGMALLALHRLDASLMNYVVSLTWLSFVTSALYAAGAPNYMLMWAAIGGTIVMQVYLLSTGRAAGQAAQSSRQIGHGALPLAILLSLAGSWQLQPTLWHVGVTLVLAAVAYVLLAVATREPNRSSVLALAHLLMLTAVGVLVYDLGAGTGLEVGVGLAIYGLIDTIALLSPPYRRIEGWAPSYARFARYLTAYLPLFVTLLWQERWETAAAGLLLTIFVNGALMLRRHDEWLVAPVMISSLILPLILGIYEHETAWRPLAIGGMYAVLAAAAGLLRYRMRSNSQFGAAWRVTYIVLLAAGMSAVLVRGSAGEAALYAGLLTAVATAIGYLEGSPRAIAVAPWLAALALERTIVANDWQSEPYAASLALAIIGGVSYVVSYAFRPTDEARRQTLVYAALTLGVIAWLISLTFDQAVFGVLFGPSVLFAVSIMLYGEAVRSRLGLSARLVALGGVILALQLAIHASLADVNWLVYSHMWAAYAAYVAWELSRLGRLDAQSAELLALALLSVPVGLQALAEPMPYATLLIAEHVVLAITGAALGRSRWIKWSVVMIILALVYLMRNLTYVNLGLIALLLIGYAIYRLQRGTGER